MTRCLYLRLKLIAIDVLALIALTSISALMFGPVFFAGWLYARGQSIPSLLLAASVPCVLIAIAAHERHRLKLQEKDS